MSKQDLGYVDLVTDPGCELSVTRGDCIVFDPTGRDLGGEDLAIGIVTMIEAGDEDDPRARPIVTVNGTDPRQLVRVTRAEVVLVRKGMVV